MPGQRIYAAEAIILRHQDLGEADRIITAYSPRLGKLRFVAKGVKRTRSRLAGHLDLLCQANLLLARGRNLDIVTQAQAVNHFPGLLASLERIGQGFYAAELVNRFTVDGVAHTVIYYLLQATLAHLATRTPNPLVLRRFEMRLLDAIGYRPQLDRCVACGRVPSEASHFSASGGGLVCDECRASEPVVRPLSPDALALLRSLQAPPEASPLSSHAVADEVEAVLRQYLIYLGERQLHAALFLDALRREETSPRGAVL